MYRKSLLALVVLAALPVTAATDRTLYVSTFEDEDGENASACSLREAIQAATNNRAYGGCIAGDLDLTDQIRLKAGIYKLKKSLIVGSAMTISGGDAANFDKTDSYTNVYPARSRLETTIEPADDNAAFSLFDSTTSRATLNLNNVILQNGKSNRGGAIRAGGSVNLSRVRISNSSATDSGGAIYLEGSSANLSAADSLFDKNVAVRGAVIGMSCLDNVTNTPHSVTLDRTSIYDNGSPVITQSVIDYCGTVTSTISASTIAENKTNNVIINYVLSENHPLHPTSSLSLTSDTIVKNLGKATLLYDNVGKLALSGSIIGFNSGKSCSYALGAAAADKLASENSKITSSYNALIKPSTTTVNDGECELPGYLYKDTGTTLVSLMPSPDTFNRILAPLYLDKDKNVLESEDGLFPAYVPLKATSAETLIDAGSGGCTATDQRGLTRNNTTAGSTTNTDLNACDIGSVEVSKLRAVDVLGVINSSLLAPIDQYEDNIDYYENIYKDPTLDAKLLNRYKKLIDDEKVMLAAYKASLAYRQVYANVLGTSTEQENFEPATNGLKAALEKFGDDFDKNYTINVVVTGRGSEQFLQLKQEKDLTVKAADSNLICKWDDKLRQILIRRTDNAGILAATTPAGEYEYCKYTITSKNPPIVSSTGYVQARIVNIAPIAKDDQYTVKYGSVTPIALDILANDSDDGDGGSDVTGYPKGYPKFYQNPATGSYANIKLVSKPTLGTLKFEYEQPCPDNSNTRPEETCYGGKITYTPKSSFSTFNDSFKYKVLDQDRAESAEATVKIINTATTTDDTRGDSGSSSGSSGSSSGGGSIGLFGLLGLASLIALRRKMK
ncbi:MAG: CSLREA domain-containing protein [Moraxellaceae bacterium]|nr:MAG: CSLREA domain-containing protein [Moraxellaceae bacterium]